MKKSNSYSEKIDRRRFVELTGVAGAAALAGCGGNGGGSAETPTDTEPSDGGSGNGGTDTGGGADTGEGTESGGGTQVYDVAMTDFTNLVPANIQYNQFNPQNQFQGANKQLFDDFAKFDYGTGEFVPYAISDWNLSGTTFEMTVRDGLTWSDGDPVTADDLVVQMRMLRTVDSALWDYAESVSAVDDRTVELTLSSETNPHIVAHQVLGNLVQVKGSKYEEYVGDSEGAARFDDMDPIASGPWSLESAGQQELVLSRREDHPDADNINFSTFKFTFLGGNQQAQQALMTGEIDSAWSLFSPPRIVANYPDAVTEARPPAKWGMGIGIDHGDTHVGKRKVRQAIMEAINRDQVIRNAGPRTKATPEIATAIATDDQQRWLGDAMSDYTGYHKGSSAVDAADQLMDEAGYSKDGGTYKDDNGNPVQLPIIVPSGWSDWVSAVQTITDHLSSAGFDAAVDARSFGSITGNVWSNPDRFRIAAFYWLPGGGQTAFPYFPLEWQLVHSDDVLAYRYPDEVTVPSRTGSGQTTVTPADRIETLATTLDEDTTREIIRELAWVANRDLPMLPIQEKLEQSFVTKDDWDVPEEGSEEYMIKWPPFWLPRQGKLTYRGN
ncbi:MAG: ABC transporter substrate-binding protein [Haloarculaceae archaeon]